MVDVADDGAMFRRNSQQIGRIGNLGHEGAVLAQRRCKLVPGAGRPVVELPTQDDLVIGDIALARRAYVFVSIVRHEPTFPIAALSRATVNGATERVLKPAASSA